ncbi:hypothetical protein [Cohaesibacter celericrescens]|uniref:hypothetical protein n=1 Tax=Cohaesibacter celericrescens TaxID=2067669 RepID=UPI00356663B9
MCGQPKEIAQKPKINLWVYNHLYFGISDQVDYIVAAFKQNGYEITVSQSPNDDALNVVIENFSADTREILVEYCTRTKKRVAVIMTEHVDLKNGKVFIHGQPLWSDNDYMHPKTQVDRLKYLFSCQSYIRCLFVLGDLPELLNMSEMLVGIEVLSIPFPRIKKVNNTSTNPMCDFAFTGFKTKFREGLLSIISANDLSIKYPSTLLAPEKRDAINISAKLVLNLPQRKEWQWLSSMRILAALRCGRATVSLDTFDTCEMAKCTYQLGIDNEDWMLELKSYSEDWRGMYDRAYDNYVDMAETFEREHPFPHDMIDFWAITDHLSI